MVSIMVMPTFFFHPKSSPHLTIPMWITTNSLWTSQTWWNMVVLQFCLLQSHHPEKSYPLRSRFAVVFVHNCLFSSGLLGPNCSLTALFKVASAHSFINGPWIHTGSDFSSPRGYLALFPKSVSRVLNFLRSICHRSCTKCVEGL